MIHEKLSSTQPPPRLMRPSNFLDAQGAAALSGGTDLIGRMKDYVSSPDRVVYLKDIKELAGISGDSKSSGLTIGAGTRLTDIVAMPRSARHTRRSGKRPSKSDRRRSATWPRWAATCSSGRVAGISAPVTASWACKTARAWSVPATTGSIRSS